MTRTTVTRMNEMELSKLCCGVLPNQLHLLVAFPQSLSLLRVDERSTATVATLLLHYFLLLLLQTCC